jgi:argininosuccinate lyase
MLATDMADYLVAKGMPFRQAHHVVGAIVRLAQARDLRLSQVPLDDLRAESALFEADIAEVFDFERSVARRATRGGTAPEAVRIQLQQAEAALNT